MPILCSLVQTSISHCPEGSAQTDFHPQWAALPDRNITLVGWDPPGYGDSRPPERNYTLDFLEKDADLAAKMMEVGFAYVNTCMLSHVTKCFL